MATRTKTRRPSTRRSSARRRLPVVPIAVAGIALLAVVALLVSLLGGDDEPAVELQETAAVTVSGDPLPPLAEALGPDPAVGQAAPSASGVSFNGDAVTTAADGRPLLLFIGAHWCPHCQAELPRVVEWREQGGGEGVDIVGVSTGARPDAPNWPPSAWWEREAFEGPVLVDDDSNTVGNAYGVSGYPFAVLVDADGTVVRRWAGAVDPAALDEAIAGL